MVFAGGPRQVGKARLWKVIAPDSRAYVNFEVAAHREVILENELPPTGAWLFEEIHKYRGWQNFLKGLYDTATGKQIFVTGRGRNPGAAMVLVL